MTTKTYLTTLEVVTIGRRLDEVCKPLPGTDYYRYKPPHSDASLAAEIAIHHPGVTADHIKKLRQRIGRSLEPHTAMKRGLLDERVTELERGFNLLCASLNFTVPPKAD